MLKAHGLRYVRDGQEILADVDVIVEPGESLAVTGPSGSGKTSLLALLSGLATPTAGEVYLNGTLLRKFAGPGDGVAVVLQGYGLVSLLTAAENIEVALRAAGRKPRAAIRAARQALTDLGLEAHMDQLVEELSGGQQQRTAVARALALEPRLLIADEPTAELDPAARAVTLNRMFEVAINGGALILATHDPEVAARCDRILDLRAGQMHTRPEEPDRSAVGHAPPQHEPPPLQQLPPMALSAGQPGEAASTGQPDPVPPAAVPSAAVASAAVPPVFTPDPWLPAVSPGQPEQSSRAGQPGLVEPAAAPPAPVPATPAFPASVAPTAEPQVFSPDPWLPPDYSVEAGQPSAPPAGQPSAPPVGQHRAAHAFQRPEYSSAAAQALPGARSSTSSEQRERLARAMSALSGRRGAVLTEYLEAVLRRAEGASSWLESSESLHHLINRDDTVPVTASFSPDDLAFLGRAREDLVGFAELGLRLLELHQPMSFGGTAGDPSRPVQRCLSCMWRWPCPTFLTLAEILEAPPEPA